MGLKVVEQYDFSRSYRLATDKLGKPYQGDRARPIQTLIWYPSQKTSGKPMTVGDYGNLLATETSFGRPELTPDWKQWLDGMKLSLKDSMWAVRDAPLLAGTVSGSGLCAQPFFDVMGECRLVRVSGEPRLCGGSEP